MWITRIECFPRSVTGAASTRTPTVADVHNIVTYFAPWQKLVLWSERELGMTTTAHLPYARFTQPGKSRSPVAQQMDAQRQAGENPKMERRSTEFSHISLIMTDTVPG